MSKIKSLEIVSDQAGVFTMSLTCIADDSEINTSNEVATVIANDAGLQLQENIWQAVHNHFDMNYHAKKISFREKNVPEGPNGKGNVLSTIPATLLRLGQISQEEYTTFNQSIINHPLCQNRLATTVQANLAAQQDIVKDFDNKVAEIKRTLGK